MIRNCILKIVLFLLLSFSLNSQSEIELRTDGIVVPRTTSAAVSSPVEGMLIYDTDIDAFKYHNGTIWLTIGEGEIQDLSMSKGVIRLSGSDQVIEVSDISPWTINGSNALKETGRVGIGNSSPNARLDIISESTEDGLRVRIDGSTKFRVRSNGGVNIGANPSSVPENGLFINGNTGLGTHIPIEKLEVVGAINLSGDASSNNPAKGTMRWNKATQDFEGYDGTNWKSLTGDPSTNQTTYAVGDFAQGGIVYWVTPDGKHGKVVHVHQLIHYSGNVTGDWSTITSEQAGASSSTEGQLNTTAIINQTGHTNSAAQMCTDLSVNGYNDWYLPAIDEIELAGANISLVNQAILNFGGSVLTRGWSSTEQSSSQSWEFVLGSASVVESKTSDRRVRAIRSF